MILKREAPTFLEELTLVDVLVSNMEGCKTFDIVILPLQGPRDPQSVASRPLAHTTDHAHCIVNVQ